MHFNDLLRDTGIELKTTLVLRHAPRPDEKRLRKSLPLLAAVRHDLFKAYQSVQTPKVERAYQKADYVASFIGVESGKAIFAGLYEIAGARPITYEQFWRKPENRSLRDDYDMIGVTGRNEIRQWFDLVLSDFYVRWMGKLSILWPGKERSWYRWADRNKFEIDYISQESQFEPVMPDWDDLVLDQAIMRDMPRTWKEKLRGWRGVYIIFDDADHACRGYVGSAYGSDNLLGRWQNYLKTGHGGNVGLRGRDPKNFRFSILQLLNEAADQGEIISLETKWKNRLHTRKDEGGLNRN